MVNLFETSTELTIVFPVYNEEPGIPQLLEALATFFQDNPELEAEVLFVDDHSTDNSPDVLRAACAANPRYRYLRLARNCGSHIAILAGLEHALGACAVFLASDLQDPPELVMQMLEYWRAANHIVWAVRERREGISWSERFFSRTFYWLLNHCSDVAFPPQGADFALLDSSVIAPLLASVGANPSIGAAIASLGFRQVSVPYTKGARKFGRSKWSLSKRLKAFADAFVGFSFAPIRFMSYTGLAMAVGGFLYACLILILRLRSDISIEGWASLMVVTLILGGIQMTMLGILGEYLWRALGEARKRPLYVLEADSDLDPHAPLGRPLPAGGNARRDMMGPVGAGSRPQSVRLPGRVP